MREKSLVLIKPDAVKKNIIGKILSCYEDVGLKIVALKMETASLEIASKHYAIHKEKPFYNDLIKFITGGPLCALILEGEDAIAKIRKLNGNTNPLKAEEGTIRKCFGSNVTENSVHASDSEENAKNEIEIWFGKVR